MTSLKERIESRQATVAVVGLGYVGLPLAVAFVEAGFQTIGIDVNQSKLDMLKSGRSYVKDVSNAEIVSAIGTGRFTVTSDYAILSEADAVSICVPTPLGRSKEPDTRYITMAVEQLKKVLHPNMLITLESTTYPGTTEELIRDELQLLGYLAGQDIFLCFSPERVDPGNERYNITNTPKVIGGITPACTEHGALLYSTISSAVVPVSSSAVAEMVKLLENTFRSVNIALVNEFSLLCDRMGINVWEVIDAAATKPFGFMPFYPGPGIGGHCIPLDPAYLAWRARQFQFYNKFIDLASDINGNMPRYVVERVADALNSRRQCLNGARVLLLGVAYKKDIDDVRESPALELLHLLAQKGAEVAYHDPHVASIRSAIGSLESVPLTAEVLASYDILVLTTNHTAFDAGFIAQHAQLIYDTRNAFKGVSGDHIFRLGASMGDKLSKPVPVHAAGEH